MIYQKIAFAGFTISTLFISQLSFADEDVYSITKSAQGSSFLFEKQVDSSIDISTSDLPLFHRRLILNDNGLTEYHYIPVIKENKNKKWIEAKNQYSKNTLEAKSICGKLTTLGEKWHSPTAKEFNNAMNNWDPEFINLMQELANSYTTDGLLADGEWFYFKNTQQGHAQVKNDASSYEPKPTICIIN